MISLYHDKYVNKKGASLIFTTHNSYYLDHFNRQDNIWIMKAEPKVRACNMYDFGLRPELLKSRSYYNNSFGTAVDYEALMQLKKDLSV